MGSSSKSKKEKKQKKKRDKEDDDDDDDDDEPGELYSRTGRSTSNLWNDDDDDHGFREIHLHHIYDRQNSADHQVDHGDPSSGKQNSHHVSNTASRDDFSRETSESKSCATHEVEFCHSSSYHDAGGSIGIHEGSRSLSEKRISHGRLAMNPPPAPANPLLGSDMLEHSASVSDPASSSHRRHESLTTEQLSRLSFDELTNQRPIAQSSVLEYHAGRTAEEPDKSPRENVIPLSMLQRQLGFASSPTGSGFGVSARSGSNSGSTKLPSSSGNLLKKGWKKLTKGSSSSNHSSASSTADQAMQYETEDKESHQHRHHSHHHTHEKGGSIAKPSMLSSQVTTFDNNSTTSPQFEDGSINNQRGLPTCAASPPPSEKYHHQHHEGASSIHSPGPLSPTKSCGNQVAKKSSASSLPSLSQTGDSFDRTMQAEQLRAFWMEDILPNWEKKRKSKKTRDLIYVGLPSSIRGKIWVLCRGNEFNVTQELFNVLLDQAKQTREQYNQDKKQLEAMDGDIGSFGGLAEKLLNSKIAMRVSGRIPNSLQAQQQSHSNAIHLDLPRTFPELAFFHNEDSQFYTSLRNVLEAYVCFRPNVGYSQGMSFIVAILLLYVEPLEAFVLFLSILHSPESMFLHFFTMQMPEVKIYLSLFQLFLKEEVPAVHQHFVAEGIDPDMYLVNWVMSTFSRTLSLDCVVRIWDVYLYEGELFIFRAALGLLKYLQPQLLNRTFEDIAELLCKNLSNMVNIDQYIECCQGIHLSSSRFREKFVSIRKTYGAPASSGPYSPPPGTKSSVVTFAQAGDSGVRDNAVSPPGYKPDCVKTVQSKRPAPVNVGSPSSVSEEPQGVCPEVVAAELKLLSPRDPSEPGRAPLESEKAENDILNWRKYQFLSPRSRSGAESNTLG